MSLSRQKLLTLSLAMHLFAVACLAQDFSNKGKEFWITYPAHVDGNLSVMGLYITSDKAASGNVQVGASSVPFTITANGVRRIFIGPNGDVPNTSVYLSQLEGIATGAGIHVTSDQPVVVYAHIIRSFRSGATLTLPTTVWGKDYIVPSYRSAGQSGANSGYGAITVVAKEANTVVEINATQSSRSGLPANTPYTITLANPGDVYQVQYPKDLDISGSVVRSIATAGVACKPIAVFSSTTWSAFDCVGSSGGDNLFQQIFPTRAWGKNFLTAPFIRKLYDIFRVYVTDPTTVVTRLANGIPAPMGTLNAAGYYEFSSAEPNQITANKPISVVQYMTSETCDNNGQDRSSDPEMVMLNPIEQTINDITVFSAHQAFVPPGQSNVTQCFLNVIIKSNAAASFRINGAAPASAFQPIPGTQYSYLQQDISALALSNPVQTLKADSSFSAIAYGYGAVESYGYNAGTAVKDLFQFISIKNEYATVNFPATCVNSPFNFSITLPYQTTQLQWKFYGRFNDTSIANPKVDSSFVVEGRTLYQYKLPRTYLLANTGTYKVTVVATNPSPDGCAGEQIIDYDLEVFPRPQTDFSWTSTGCVTDSVRFKDLSNGFGRVVNRWLWDFGDGTTSTVKDPAKKYANPGAFTVKQQIITDIGCITDATKTVALTNPPTAKFTVSNPQCATQNISFSDGSSPPAGSTIAKWFWDFGNGRKDTVTTNAARTVTYATAGSYTVSLIVETNTGCRSVTFSQVINVNPLPLPDFVLPGGICLPAGSAIFTNSSTIPAQSTPAYTSLWDFGDGGTSTSNNATHVYTGAGPFTIKLTITSAAGCSASATKTLSTVYAQPKATFTIQPAICLGEVSNLQSAATANGQNIIKYYYRFSPAILDSGQALKKTLTAAGNYNVQHWVVTDKGCVSDTVISPHKVNALPQVKWAVISNTCIGIPVSFQDQTTSADGIVTNRNWTFGDGTQTDAGVSALTTHNYTTNGTKTVSLQVVSSTGCKSATDTKTISIGAKPTAAFLLPEVCLTDASASFSNQSTLTDNAVLNYTWNFGDANATAGNPNTSNAADANHKYSAVGNYNVVLIAASAGGCADTLKQLLTVNGDKPKASFTMTSLGKLCSNLPVTVTNTSTVNFGSLTKLEIYWDWPSSQLKTMDDNPLPNETYSQLYPAFNSPASKAVSIRMLAYSGGVCVNELIQSYTLYATPKATLTPFASVCLNGTAITLTNGSDAANLGGNDFYRGVGIIGNNLFTPAGTGGAGAYSLEYVRISADGCRDSVKQNITVWPTPQAAFSTVGSVCEKNSVIIKDESVAGAGNITTRNWTFGDGTPALTSNTPTASHIYSTAANYNVQLQVTTSNGCLSPQLTKAIGVNPLPKPQFSLPVVCLPAGRAAFTESSTIADGTSSNFTYSWNFGDGSAPSSQKNAVHNYSSTGPFDVKLVVTSGSGCKDSLIQKLTDVNPQPLAAFTINPSSVCLGLPMQFADISNAAGQTVTQRFWTMGDGDKPSTQTFTKSYASAGQYPVSFYYQTAKGCFSDTVTQTAGVFAIPQVSAGPDVVVLLGGQVALKATATGSSNYTFQWSPATGLSASDVLQPLASPPNDITYTLKVTAGGGCSSSDAVAVKVLLAPVIPNAFSPNGDGINDRWEIRYLDTYPGAVVQVFDRFGKRVHYNKGYLFPWDGKIAGVGVPTGVYYYVIEPGNGRKPYQGSLTVIR